MVWRSAHLLLRNSSYVTVTFTAAGPFGICSVSGLKHHKIMGWPLGVPRRKKWYEKTAFYPIKPGFNFILLYNLPSTPSKNADLERYCNSWKTFRLQTRCWQNTVRLWGTHRLPTKAWYGFVQTKTRGNREIPDGQKDVHCLHLFWGKYHQSR